MPLAGAGLTGSEAAPKMNRMGVSQERYRASIAPASDEARPLL